MTKELTLLCLLQLVRPHHRFLVQFIPLYEADIPQAILSATVATLRLYLREESTMQFV